MTEAEGETTIVDPLSNDEQIRAVLDQFAASHQEVDAKPRRAPAKKKVEAAVPDESEESEERALEPGESMPGATFDGMGGEDLDDEDDEPDGLPVVHRKPKPDVGQKDDIWAWYEKFKIGVDPDMSIQLLRTYPKIFPNGVVAEGPLDAFPTPIDEEYIARTYGGGMYEIFAMGPGKGGHGRRRFSKYTVKIPGAADSTKPSSLVRDAAGRGDTRMQPAQPPAPSENVGVVQQALKTLEKSSDDAQRRAKTAEDRVLAGAANGTTEAGRLADVIREESDKRIQLMREQSERESRQLEERLRDRDQKIEELRGEVTHMQNATPGMIKEMAEALRPQQQAPGMGQDMMNSILTKHAAEIEAMRSGYSREVEATRAAHLREIDAMRQSHERERDGDRREAAAREQRVVDQLEQAREERRRDNEMHKQIQEQRDTASRDREQSRIDLVETMWQARLRSAEESSNFRISALSADAERLRNEVAELRSKAREDGDVYTQFEKAKGLLDMAREHAGGGLGGESEPVMPAQPQGGQKSVIDQVMEHGPTIAKVIGDLVGGDAGGKKKRRQQQEQPPMGAVVNTPQGRMVVTPQGFVPEQIFLQHMSGRQNVQPRMFQQPQQQPQQHPQQQQQPQQQPQPTQAQPQRPQQSRRTSRPQNEGVVQEAPAPNVVVAPNIYDAQAQIAGANEPLSGTAASFVAKALDHGLNGAMEIDEFIEDIQKKVPETYLQDLVKYTAPEVIASIREHAPKSLALSPGGLEFTAGVMHHLRAMYGIT